MPSARAFLSLGLLLALSAGADAARSTTRATATYQGFRLTADGAELYLLLDRAPAEPQLKASAGAVDLVLPRTRAARAFRPLDVRYFASTVRTVETRRRGQDLIVHITLKAETPPRLDVREDKGVTTVSLSFPRGEPSREDPPRPGGVGWARSAGGAAAEPGTGEDVCALCTDLYRNDPEAAAASGCAAECANWIRKRADAPRVEHLRRRAATGDASARRLLCLADCPAGTLADCSASCFGEPPGGAADQPPAAPGATSPPAPASTGEGAKPQP